MAEDTTIQGATWTEARQYQLGRVVPIHDHKQQHEESFIRVARLISPVHASIQISHTGQIPTSKGWSKAAVKRYNVWAHLTKDQLTALRDAINHILENWE